MMIDPNGKLSGAGAIVNCGTGMKKNGTMRKGSIDGMQKKHGSSPPLSSTGISMGSSSLDRSLQPSSKRRKDMLRTPAAATATSSHLFEQPSHASPSAAAYYLAHEPQKKSKNEPQGEQTSSSSTQQPQQRTPLHFINTLMALFKFLSPVVTQKDENLFLKMGQDLDAFRRREIVHSIDLFFSGALCLQELVQLIGEILTSCNQQPLFVSFRKALLHVLQKQLEEAETAKTDKEAKALLAGFGMPFKKEGK